MHPHIYAWWKHARREPRHAEACDFGGCGVGGCGGGARWGGGGQDVAETGFAHHFGGPEHDADFGGGAFGVRRPLRFLSHRLDLTDEQVAELARILTELKTDRAQAAVDHRRSTAALADAIGSERFDQEKAAQATSERVHSAERLREAVLRALGQIHELLTPEQRSRFAYLLRTGALSI